MKNIEERRKYDREHKRLQRALNTDYANRVRAKKRDSIRKDRRKELRSRDESKVKEAAYARKYRQRPEVVLKNKARSAVNYALAKGLIMRPSNCELCGEPDRKLRGGRSGLRADHYKGYEFVLEVRFVCTFCDGKQERERGNTTLGKRIASDSWD